MQSFVSKLPARSRLAAVFLLCLFGPGPGFNLLAEETPSERVREWHLESGLFGGTSPLVGGVNNRVAYSIPLHRHRSGALWDSSRVEAGLAVLANPSFTDLVARLYLEPIAVFDVRLEGGVREHYTTFGYGLAWAESYSDTPSAAGGPDRGRSAQTSHFLRVAPRVKGAVGPVIATSTLIATWYRFPEARAPFLEESVSLRVISEEDWVLQNTAQLLYRFTSSPRSPFTALGLEHAAAWVPGAPSGDQEPLHRLALFGVYVRQLRENLALQTALFAGGYPTGEPFGQDRLYLLGAVTLAARLPHR
jgi:hypothetical protein